MIKWREANEQGKTFQSRKRIRSTPKTGIGSTRKENETDNDELYENSPVEILREEVKRLRTNELMLEYRLRLREEKGVGGREKQRQLGTRNR